MENFRPGVMRRLGFDYATLSAANPRLVYCSISGYGQDGAHASLPAYAPIVQAASGFDVTAMSYQRADRPPNSAIFVADYLTGVHAFGASCAALVRRERSGKGEYIDCALMDSMLGMLAYEVAEAQEPVSRPRPLFQATRAKDGFLIVAPISQGNFEDMAHAMGRDDLKADARFATVGARSEQLGRADVRARALGRRPDRRRVRGGDGGRRRALRALPERRRGDGLAVCRGARPVRHRAGWRAPDPRDQPAVQDGGRRRRRARGGPGRARARRAGSRCWDARPRTSSG